MGPGSIAAASVRSVRSILSGSTNSNQIERDNLPHERKADVDTDSGSGSDSDLGDDSEEDSESIFIYSRVAKLPPTFLRKDLISACRMSSVVHIYGTHSGMLHLCKPDGTAIKTVRVHRSSVLDIALANDEFVATASIDGTTVISSILDPSDLAQASYRRPVHALALHPDYRDHRCYISGGTAGQVILSEKGWLKSRSDKILAQTQSTILAIAWPTPSRLLWCNEDGITVFDPEMSIVVNRISRSPHSPRADLFRPRISSYGFGQAIVAWHKTISLINLETGKLDRSFDCPATLAGAVAFGDKIAVLAVGHHQQPKLQLIDPKSGAETYEDELEMMGGSRLGVNDYHLAVQPSKLYIISCEDAVVARERTAHDHVDWLLEHRRFTEAYSASKQIHPETQGRRDIGLLAVTQLVESEKWEAAAHLLPDILEDGEWLEWATKFVEAEQHIALGEVVPQFEIGDVHDAILRFALHKGDLQRLSSWVDAWPVTLYDGPSLASDMSVVIRANESARLRIILSRLWLKLGEYVRAVQCSVAANSGEAFYIASHYHLWTEPGVESILGQVLSSGDGENGNGEFVDRLRELIRSRAEISPDRVVSQLKGQDLLLFGYLTELGLVDETWLSEFADLMIVLYIKYDPQKLHGFLERFNSYDIEASIALCKENGLDNELVYLLGRIGKSQESIEIMVNKLQDYEHAVSFARGQGSETWDYLISYCSEHPGLVLALLQCAEVSPAPVLAMVPKSMRIEGLKQALCKVLNGQEISLELNEGVLAIVRSESQEWIQALRSLRLKGTEVDDPEKIDWSAPQLITNSQYEKVEARQGTTFAGKIAHLRYLLGL